MMAESSTGVTIALALAFELAMHVFVHYTVPGAQFASWLAQSISPALDAVGLTTVFSDSAGYDVAAGVSNALPSLGDLAVG